MRSAPSPNADKSPADSPAADASSSLTLDSAATTASRPPPESRATATLTDYRSCRRADTLAGEHDGAAARPTKVRSRMTATLKMTHKAIGVEVRRGTYDVVVDGERAGSLEMNDTIEIPIEPGRHTLQIRSGRKSSRTQTFEAAESQTVAFRCTGKSFLPIFLASFAVPSLALQLRREADDR
jgi:hypothetical protein